MKSIIDMLEKDHEKVRSILAKLAGTSSRARTTRERLIEQLKQEITLHMKFEEKSLYPKFVELTEDEDRERSAIEEHDETREIMKEIESADPASDELLDLVQRFTDAIEHHIGDEETKMFPAMRKNLQERDDAKLAQQYAKQKERAMMQKTEGASAGRPSSGGRGSSSGRSRATESSGGNRARGAKSSSRMGTSTSGSKRGSNARP